jgi:hypothetical protein
MGADQRVVDLNLVLPPPPALPPGVSVPFEWVRVRGNRVLISGHGPLDPQGAPADLDVFGDDVGAHARTAIGVPALPLNLPVVVAAEVEIDQWRRHNAPPRTGELSRRTSGAGTSRWLVDRPICNRRRARPNHALSASAVVADVGARIRPGQPMPGRVGLSDGNRRRRVFVVDPAAYPPPPETPADSLTEA